MPFWPYQGLLAGQLFFRMFGRPFLLSAVVPIHPLDAYGPPGAAASDVKPDWYLMWIYGFLKLIPAGATIRLFGQNIGPAFLGGVLFLALVIELATLAPWLDRTNHAASHRFEYLEPALRAAVRYAVGVADLAFLGMTFVAAYYDEIGIPLALMWLLFAVPAVVGLAAFALAKAYWSRRERFDPRATEPSPLARPGQGD